MFSSERLEPSQELLDPGLVGIELERAGEAAARRGAVAEAEVGEALATRRPARGPGRAPSRGGSRRARRGSRRPRRDSGRGTAMPPARPRAPRAPRRAAAGCAPRRRPAGTRSRARRGSGSSRAPSRRRRAPGARPSGRSSFFCWRSTSLRFQSAEPRLCVHLERLLEGGLRRRELAFGAQHQALVVVGAGRARAGRARRRRASPRRRRRSRAPSASRPPRRRSSRRRGGRRRGRVVRRVVHGLAGGRRDAGQHRLGEAEPARKAQRARAASSRPASRRLGAGWPGAGAMPGPQSR